MNTIIINDTEVFHVDNDKVKIQVIEGQVYVDDELIYAAPGTITIDFPDNVQDKPLPAL